MSFVSQNSIYLLLTVDKKLMIERTLFLYLAYRHVHGLLLHFMAEFMLSLKAFIFLVTWQLVVRNNFQYRTQTLCLDCIFEPFYKVTFTYNPFTRINVPYIVSHLVVIIIHLINKKPVVVECTYNLFVRDSVIDQMFIILLFAL